MQDFDELLAIYPSNSVGLGFLTRTTVPSHAAGSRGGRNPHGKELEVRRLRQDTKE
jgi:hypothetical protein